MRIRALACGLRPRRLFRGLCALYVAFLVVGAFPIAGQAGDEEAKLVFAGLASGDCDSRLEAISRYSKSEDNAKDRNAALKQLTARADSALKEQVFALLALMEDGREGSARILALTERASQFDKLARAERVRALRQTRQELLQIIHSPKETIAARIGASWPLVRVLLAAGQDHPEWKTEWAKELGAMLKSAESSVRLVGAVTAALGRFPKGSDPVKADVVRPLIDGLSHETVSVRSAAYIGLRQALGEIPRGMCFDATDASDRRAAAIRQWESWWKENSQKLGLERIVQRFW